MFVVLLCTYSSVVYIGANVKIIRAQPAQRAVYVYSVCSCMCAYECTCLWVLGRSEVLVGLIETDHCQRSRSSGRLSWNTNTDRNRGCLTHTRTEMCRLILFLFLSSPSSFSSSTLSPVFINPLLWCLASCPLALSAVDWPWWCHGHHENVSLM